jgi:NADH dehydrogenase
VDVLLVDIENFALFTPMLPEVATGDIETRHILVPHRDLLPPRSFRQGRLLEIDFGERTALIETRHLPRRDVIRWDHVLFTPGGVTDFFGVKGAAEHAFTFKTIGDAVVLRNRILAHLERASIEGSPEGREALCRILVAGAGYSGVELAASLADFLRGARRQYPELAAVLRVSLVEKRTDVAPTLPPPLRRACRERLAHSGVDLRLGTGVAEVAEDAVVLDSGERLATLTTIWTAGVRPQPDLARWGLPVTPRGSVRADRFLAVEGFPGVWAAGDAASIPMEDGGTAPPTAQHAMREGRHAAENILAAVAGRAPAPYRYRAKGELVSLGHRQGAGIVMGVMLRGFPAWWLWRSYYLLRLPTWLRRVRVATDWTIDLFFHKDVVQLPVRTERDRAGTGAIGYSAAPRPPAADAPR